MSYIVLAGQHYYPSKWGDFRGKCDHEREIELLLKVAFDEGLDWVQIINVDTMKIEREYRRSQPPCRECNGNGQHGRWLNSVGADKIMKPVIHYFTCAACKGRMVDRSQPEQWVLDENRY